MRDHISYINEADLAPKDKYIVVLRCKTHNSTYLDHTSPPDMKKYTSKYGLMLSKIYLPKPPLPLATGRVLKANI